MSKHRQKTVKKDEMSSKAKYMSYFIIAIMILSIGGFALLSGGSIGSNDGSSEVPLQADVFTNSQTGEKYWGAVLNHEQFIFMNGVEGYDQRVDIAQLASQIKNLSSVKIYVPDTYQSSDSVFVVEKALNGIKKAHERIIGNVTCDSSTLAFVNNDSQAPGCLQFIAPEGEEYTQADILVYHLIK